ncbi:hypothetical protein [Bacillus massiliigorillae]|uniref:hypothetical protein n=1 Tax=Bacillus massiliigorillae TaxID=1243664 RepID=UPI0003AAB64F|nr:hypothetical protein [Bacillus massiliigorillae]
MKKLPLVISLMGLLLVAGCGNDSASDEGKESKPSSDVTTTNETKPKTDDQTTSNKEPENDVSKETNNTPSEKETTSNSDTNTTVENEKNLTENNQKVENTTEKMMKYQLQGQTKEESAKLSTSENQGYKMYLLPEYELTGEEPGKDMLYLKNAEHISMRIELLQENPNWAVYEENIPTELGDTNSTITSPTESALQIPNAKIYEASNGQDRVTIYLIQDAKQPMKLTIFTTENEDYRIPMVEMAKTIVKQ